MKRKLTKYIMSALLVVAAVDAGAARVARESVYQGTWCGAHGGETEVILRDKARADCVAQIDGQEYAIEFDFADKWAEAIGQALYYAAMLDRKAGVVLIVEDFKRDKKYIDRYMFATQFLGIRLWLTD